MKGWNSDIYAVSLLWQKNFISPVRPSGCTSSSRLFRGRLRNWKKNWASSFFFGRRAARALTCAGELFHENVPRVFTALKQARDSVTAAANGFHSQLRVALSDGITPSKFSAFLALCRQEEPEIDIRLFEVTLTHQIKGLHDDLYDIGFAQSNEVGDGVIAEPIWDNPLMLAVPARHPLLKYKRIPLEEVLHYPLVLDDPVACEGHTRQVGRALRQVEQEPLFAERVTTIDLMMALVSAGFALDIAGASQIAASRKPGVMARPLAGRTPLLTTYLLRLDNEPSDALARFIARVNSIESLASKQPAFPTQPDTSEEIEP